MVLQKKRKYQEPGRYISDPQKQRPSWEFWFLVNHKLTVETSMNVHSEWYTHAHRNAHNYKQAMKTGKHEDKPQVWGQLLTIGNLIRRDYEKSFLLITLILETAYNIHQCYN